MIAPPSLPASTTPPDRAPCASACPTCDDLDRVVTCTSDHRATAYHCHGDMDTDEGLHTW